VVYGETTSFIAIEIEKMKRLKITILATALLLIAVISPSRYLKPDAGVTTTVDYANHLNISSHVRTLDLFPSIDSLEQGRHGVSKYLPIYHGLIGFHLTAAVLEILGIPLPGAYNLLLDLCLLSILVVFVFFLIDRRKENVWGVAFSAILIPPLFYGYFVQAVVSGFYSQLLSQALIVIAFYLFAENWKKTSVGLFIFALFCYPDFLIWIIPVALLSPKYNWKIKVPLLLPLAVLAITPFARGTLAGPVITSYYVYLSAILLVLTLLPNLWKQNRKIAIASASFVIYSLALILVTMKHFNASYYGTKIAAFSYLLLPYLLVTNSLTESFKKKVVFVIVGFLVISAYPDLASINMLDYLKARTSFNNSNYRIARIVFAEIQNSVSSCNVQSTYKIPASGDDEITNGVFNGVLMNFDIYSIDTNPYLNLIQQLKEESPEVWMSNLEQKIQSNQINTDFCLAVPHKEMSIFANSQYFEKLYEGAQFVYVKPQKP
jgi:hypothetical protein